MCRNFTQTLFSSKMTAPTQDAIPLGKNRFAAVKRWRGHQFLDIREYYKDEEDMLKPGLKGVTLKRSQWNHFKNNFHVIDNKLVSEKVPFQIQ